MAPHILAKLKAAQQEQAAHDSSKTHHYAKLGQAFVANKPTLPGRGGTGRGGLALGARR
jgi:hypothetical protein